MTQEPPGHCEITRSQADLRLRTRQGPFLERKVRGQSWGHFPTETYNTLEYYIINRVMWHYILVSILFFSAMHWSQLLFQWFGCFSSCFGWVSLERTQPRSDVAPATTIAMILFLWLETSSCDQNWMPSSDFLVLDGLQERDPIFLA